MKSNADTVTASEIAAWGYCPEAWRLEHALGLEAFNQKEKTAGIRHHARKEAVERAAGVSISIGRVLIVAALLGLAAWLLGR